MTPNFAAATKAMQDVTAQAQTSFENIYKAGQAQFGDVNQRMVEGLTEMAAMSQANMQAVVEAGTVAAKGAEEAGREVADFAKAQVEKNVEAGKAMFAVKDPRELMDLQTGLIKGNMDAGYAEMVKLSKMAMAMNSAFFAPLTARVNVVFQRMAQSLNA